MRKKIQLVCLAILCCFIYVTTFAANSDEKKLTVTVNTTLSSAFDMLSSMSGKNIVLDSNVPATKNIGINVKNMTFDQILDIMLQTNQLQSQTIGNAIVVYPANQATNYMDLVTEYIPLGTLDATSVSNLLRAFIQTNSGESINADSNSNGIVVKASKVDMVAIKNMINTMRTTEEKVTKTYYLSYAVAKDLQSAIQGLTQIRQLSLNDKINTLTVVASKNMIKEIDSIVAAADIETPQVLIKVMVFSSNPSLDKTLGFDFDKGTTTLQGTSGIFKYLKISGIPTSIIGTYQNNQAEIISNPTIRAVNGTKATLKIGQEYPIVIAQSSSGTSGSSTTSTDNYVQLDVTTKQTGLTLELTPHVHRDDRVSLEVSLNMAEHAGDVSTPAGNYPLFDQKNVKTLVRLNNGETIVFGGLIEKNSSVKRTSWPILGDLPFIGKLFSKTQTTERPTEIVMLITPYIVNNIQNGKSIDYHYFTETGNDQMFSERVQERKDQLMKEQKYF